MSSLSFIESLRGEYLQMSPHMRECDLRVGALSADGATMELPSREAWLGDVESGRYNPGIITVLVDSTAGLAVLAHAGRYDPIATLDLRLDYLRPAFVGRAVFCRARCIRMTRSIAFVQASVWQDDEQTPLAHAQGVFMRAGAQAAPADRAP